jgi:8-amino-7-oxononanoate synthase
MTRRDLPESRQELFALGLELLDKGRLMERLAEQGISRSDLLERTSYLHDVVERLKSSGRFLYGMPVVSRPGPRVTVEEPDGTRREMVMFASNDYLGLSSHPEVLAAVREILDTYGIGAGSSRVNVGYSGAHRSLEAKLAQRWGKEAALLFPTGFDAVSSSISALCGPGDRVIMDASSHACIIDGAQRSGAAVKWFRHNDPARLEAQLRRARERTMGGILVVVEGAYSMDGDVAPLHELVPLCKAYGARVMVDEAHAIGVVGSGGHGAVEHFGLQEEVDLIVGTFSKALGATGGFVVADRPVITYLNYLSTRIVFSAAFPPILAHAVSRAIDLMEEDGALRERLTDNVRYFSQGFRNLGLPLPDVQVGAVPVRVHRDEVMVDFASDLYDAGIFTYPIVYPSVPRGRSMFRLAVQAGHSRDDLDQALEVFHRLLRTYEVL